MSDLSWPLERAARLYAGDVAVVDGERSVTYGELARRVRALGGLEAQRVGFLGPNSLAHLECWLGLPAFGKVLVDLNFRLSVDELAFMVRDAGLDALISDDPRAAELGVPLIDYEALVSGPEHDFPGVDEDAPAAISYTGGTTGTPKGVVLSHRNLLSNALHNLAVTGPLAGGPLAARVPDVPRGGHVERVRLHVGGCAVGDPPALRAGGGAGGDRGARHHARGVRPDDARDAARTRDRHARPPPPAVRGLADLARPAAAGARVAAGLRRRPVLRDDRGRADRHAALARGPRHAAVLDGRARPGRAGAGAGAAAARWGSCGCAART